MVIQAEFVEAMTWILKPDQFQFPENPEETIYTVPEQLGLTREIFITTKTPLLVFVDPFGYNGKKYITNICC